MKHKNLGENERTIIRILTENNNEVKRIHLIKWVRTESGKSYETISWSLKNMVSKGLIYYDPLTTTYTLPDHWREVLKQERGIDAPPQQLVGIDIRIELMRIALDQKLVTNEIEAYGLYGLLDLNLDSLKKVTEQFSNECSREGRNHQRRKEENSQLIREYLNALRG